MLSNRLPTIASRIFSSLRQSVRPVSSTISDTERIKDYVSHYDTLEVVPGCTKTEIRESWLRLSMLYHPDLNKGNKEATRMFMAVKEAYGVLNDEKKRSEYDDQIGFKHADPPPDYHKKWSYKAEMDRIKADQYKVLWNEEKIRELMSSEKLREVDWNKKTPAERHQLLVEEEERQEEALKTMKDTKTPSLLKAQDKYFFMMSFILFVYFILQKMENKKEALELSLRPREVILEPRVELESGAVISSLARAVTDEELAAHNRKFADDEGMSNGTSEESLRE